MALKIGSKGDQENADAEGVPQDNVTAADSAVSTADPYADLDLLSLEELRKVAKDNDVSLPEDVERSMLITELRAARSRGNLPKVDG